MTLSTLDSEMNDESTHSFAGHSASVGHSGSGEKTGGTSSQDEKSGGSRPYGAGMPESILTETERQIMRMSRITVMIVLLSVACTAIGLTWHLTSSWDKSDFEDRYRIIPDQRWQQVFKVPIASAIP
eukprot:scaffold500_cov124-Cylindrotheca_fusiformis.AAC.2